MAEAWSRRARRSIAGCACALLVAGGVLIGAQPVHAQQPDAPPASVSPAITVEPTAARDAGNAQRLPSGEAAQQDRASQQHRAALPHDLSPWSMFLAADIVVKGVMIGLGIASILVWTVWVAKTVELMLARANLKRAFALIASERSLADARGRLDDRHGVAQECIAAVEAELSRSDGIADVNGIERRAQSRVADIEAAAVRAMRAGTGLIATVGATAPFVGLFGTVWGIMNSFVGISKAQTTNLAVVAPGIAEALLATAIGLIAAIPAVILYNQLARATAAYRAQVRETASEILRLLSRDLARSVQAQARHARSTE